MNGMQAKGARWALAIVLALVCAVVVALPVLASADTEPETAQVGEVVDKQADDADKQGNEAAKKATGADEQAGDGEQGATGEGDGESIEMIAQAQEYQGKELQIHGPSEFAPGAAGGSLKELYLDNNKLEQGKDYEIVGYKPGNTSPSSATDFDSNSHAETPGPCYAVVTFKGESYAGWGYVGFQVKNGSGGGDQQGSLHVELLQNEYVYTGQPANVQISSVNYQGKALSAGEYEISGYKKVVEGSGPTPISGAPSETGRYKVVVSGLGQYVSANPGEPEFSIVEANSLESKNRVSVTTDRKYYTLTGASLQPKVTVTFDGKELVEGTDYTVKYQYMGGPKNNTEVDKVTETGTYRAVAHAVEGGQYTGTAESTHIFEVVSDPADLQFATLALAGEKSYGNQTINPTVTWADGSATPPAMTVTSAAGDVLKEGTHFTFQYKKDGKESNWTDAITAGEGTYSARAVAIGGSGYKGESRETLRFFVAAADHDMTKATVTLPDTFTWKNDAEITDELKAKLAVKLGNAVLTVDKDFDISHMSPNNWRPGTGVVGKHTLVIMGNMSSSARHQGNEGPQISGEKYYGVTTVTYGVWNDEAPAADQRVDTATGVKVAGSTIASNSTIKTEEWVSFGASKLSDADVAAVPAVKAAKDAAASSGAVEVLAYDAKLEHRSANGSTEGMTEDLDITLSFPVDAKYNGKKATITQIHDGVAMNPVTVTIANGQASVPTDRLSEFVISVSDEKAADEKATEEKAATKGDKAADSKTTGKTTTAKTGDVVLPMVIGALVVIAIVAVVALLVSRRRSNS